MTTNQQEPFAEVLARARMRAHGITPPQRPLTSEERQQRERELDSHIGGVVQRFAAKAGLRLEDLDSLPPPPPPRPRSAAEVRISWYIPPRHQLDVLELCPRPVPRPGLPEGACECEGVHHYVPQDETQQAAFEAAQAWAERAGRREGNCLALTGKPGTGKSHLFYAAIRRANQRGVNAAAARWGEFANVLRDAKSPIDPEFRSAAIYKRDRVLSAQAFGFDEIRLTSGTDFDEVELSQITTGAYSECQDLFVNSNAASERLRQVVGMAATSRLTEIVVTGPDYRNPGASS